MIFNGCIQNQCIDMGIVFSSVDKSRHPPWSGFLTNSEFYKNTKFEIFWSVFNITRKLIKEHSEEILNMECLEYSSPSWTTSELANDQAIEWAKAKVCVYADSVVCWTQMKDTPGATERWKGQVEDLKKNSSYQNAVGLDGEPIDFELKMFPGCSSLSLLREIQHDLVTKNNMPEDFKDRIIFMSMFNDIEWKKNDEKYISNAEEVRNYAMKYLQGHWTFLGPGSDEKWYGDSHDQKRQWNCTANKMVQQFKETGHPVFKSSALSRGILKQRKGRCTIHFNGVSINTELLFRTVHSVNQLSVHGAVANWCDQFAMTEEEKGRVGIIVNNETLTMVQPEDVELLVSSSDPGAWKQDAGKRKELPNPRN